MLEDPQPAAPAIPAELPGYATGNGRWVWHEASWKRQPRHSKRTVTPEPRLRNNPIDRLIAVLFPWRVWEYPGYFALTAAAGGVGRQQANYWLSGKHKIGAASAGRIAALCEGKIIALQGLAAEFREIERKGQDLQAHAARMNGRKHVARFERQRKLNEALKDLEARGALPDELAGLVSNSPIVPSSAPNEGARPLLVLPRD